jgi:hypothetical protein
MEWIREIELASEEKGSREESERRGERQAARMKARKAQCKQR